MLIVMSRVVIRTPFPTPEETARIMGVSKADLKWLRALAERVMPTGGTVPNGVASDRASAANKKARSVKLTRPKE